MFTPESYPLVLVQGIMPRSGTNYIGKLMSYHPTIRQIPPNVTSGEFPLLTGITQMKALVAHYDQRFQSPGIEKQKIEFADVAPYLGRASLQYLVDRYQIPPGMLCIKEPRVWNLDRVFELFPDVKLVIWMRDGRDQNESHAKASLASHQGKTQLGLIKARIEFLTGRHLITSARNWARAAGVIRAFDEKFKDTPRRTQYRIMRYEEVYQDPKTQMAGLLDFLGLPYDDALLDKMANAEVVGSSFYSANQTESNTKNNWQPTPKSENFNPVGRWQKWSPTRKTIYKRFAGQALIDMGYAKDLNW